MNLVTFVNAQFVHVVSLRSHHLCRRGICVVLMVMFVVALLYNSRQVSSTEFPALFNSSQLASPAK